MVKGKLDFTAWQAGEQQLPEASINVEGLVGKERRVHI